MFSAFMRWKERHMPDKGTAHMLRLAEIDGRVKARQKELMATGFEEWKAYGQAYKEAEPERREEARRYFREKFPGTTEEEARRAYP